MKNKTVDETVDEIGHAMNIADLTIDIAAQQPIFAGHFPEQPILPGVFLLNFMRRQLQALHGEPLHFSRMRRVKFLRPIVPGSRIRIESQHICANWYRCRVLSADGLAVAQAEIEFERGAYPCLN